MTALRASKMTTAFVVAATTLASAGCVSPRAEKGYEARARAEARLEARENPSNTRPCVNGLLFCHENTNPYQPVARVTLGAGLAPIRTPLFPGPSIEQRLGL